VAAGRSGTQDHGTHTHHMHRVNFESLKGRTIVCLSRLILSLEQTDFNISHTIARMHFGESYSGKVDPLNGVTVWENQLAQYTYFVNVVPTVVQHASGRETPSHQ
jgi:hypothetical protein